jgi:thioredoxin
MLSLRGGAGAKVLSPKRSMIGKIMAFIASFFDPAFGGNYAGGAAQAPTAAPAAAPARASRMNRQGGGRTISVDDLKQMEGGRVKPIKNAAEMKRAIASSKLTVVDFWASWCGPCMQIKPKFAKISDRYGGVGFYAVDVDAAKPVSQAHSVSSMPTFVFFKGGKEVERFSGADEEKLSTIIERLK